MLNIVVGRDGRVACRGFGQRGLQAYREAYGMRVMWRPVTILAGRCTDTPPSDLLTWETAEGARKFAGMNGGTVTTVTEFFYSPSKIVTPVTA